MFDIHSHILPEVDDGPKSWEAAEAMCRMAAADGIEHMAATPHSNDRYFYDREYLSNLLQELQRRIGDRPKLSLGCDFHLSFENMQSALQDPTRYRIGNGRYLLVEFSNFSIPAQVDEWFTKMCQAGTTPIITHPERNPILQESPQRVLQWIELGCTVQVTGSIFTGSWGARARQVAEWLLQRKGVHFLATDAHDTERRPPVLSAARRALAKQFGEPTAHALVEANPQAVMNDTPLPTA
ncbi:MAG: exopolysaccharide biosynthesis protein [Acidobacteria bacterium]|nr:MAG: exopolysaccharide biosynthesis protein [Acidobacteriota bacterium]